MEATHSEGSGAEQGLILLADDEETFLSATAALLRRSGFGCEAVHDAREAMHILRARPIDTLVTDLRMPGNEGMSFLEEVKAAFPLLPVVVVTGFPSVPTAVAALRLAAVDYLTKPFEFAKLLTTVRRAVARGRAARAALRLSDDVASWVANHYDDARAAGLTKPEAEEAPRPPRPEGSHAAPVHALSTREREILEWMIRGERVSAIAPALGISSHTVRNHVKSIFRKLGVHSQVELLGRFR